MLSEQIMIEHFGAATNGKPNSDVNNLVQTSWKSEKEVVDCLEKRYLEGKVYTWAGIALLAINPCVEIPDLFTRKVKEQYSDIRNAGKTELSPHVYAVAARAQYKLTEGLGQSNQVIVISGDSGSGKTYTAWHVLNFVAISSCESGRGTSDMIWQICCSMPVLSAFGNAQTTCNNNSSRFGKLLQLQHKNGQIVGAYFETYLLEKTRTSSLPKNERNFHIFHQLLAGLEEDDWKRFYLNPETEYKIVPGPITRKDRDSFYETKNALIAIGITALLKIQVFQVLASLLHLGNINFIRSASCYAYELDLYDEDSYNGFESASKLLGLEETSLSNLLTTTLIVAPTGGRYRRTVYQKPAVTPEECQCRRDCFVRFIYERLFKWIVAHINSRVAANCSTSLLGILDIYGFEVFENNSLEQLCINYANERLQLFFTRDFLNQQKDLLQDEDHELQLLSHGHSLERVMQLDGPSSVFSVFNEECLLQRYSNDSVVSSRLISSLGSSKYVFMPRCTSSQEEFIVKHYAGDVCYSMNGMLEKNTDKVPREFLDVLRTSTNDFVQKLLDTVEEEQATAARKNTLLIKFKNSVDSLCKILEKSDAHYIRCIKASTHFIPRVVDSEFLHQQLQASGIMEIISLSHLYFPIRLKFNEFESRYASCWKDSIKIKRNNDSKHVQLIAERILVPLKVEKQVKFGRESLFLSELALLKLEKWRSEQRLRAVSIIQRAWRRARKRRESRGVRYSYRLRLVTDSGRGDTDQIPHRGTPGRVTGLQGSGDAVRMQKEGVTKKTQRSLPPIYMGNGIVSRRPLAQETHIADEDQLRLRGRIPGYDIIGATYHHAYGVATCVRSTIDNASLLTAYTDDNIHTVVIKIGEVIVTNVYKPPVSTWPPQVLQVQDHPAVYIGDFNSHHEEWKYAITDVNGENLMSWAEEHNIHLVFDRGSSKISRQDHLLTIFTHAALQ